MTVKYPHITIELVGQDGNAFSILGRLQRALRSGGVPRDEIDAVIAEATSGDYGHLLRTVMATVEVAEDEDEDDWEDCWEDEDAWSYDEDEEDDF